MNHQTCKVCKQRDKFNYNVPDLIWEAVVPKKFQNRVVCLSCFDDFAYKKGIDISGVISTPIYFVGDKVIFEFQLVKSNEKGKNLMKDEIVLVRADANKALIRKIWGLGKNIVYVINEDKPEITPIGVPKEDVYIYDPHLIINTDSNIDWNALTQWGLELG